MKMIFLFRKREKYYVTEQIINKIWDCDIKERIYMVMNDPNVEIYLSNKYQIDENYRFFLNKSFP